MKTEISNQLAEVLQRDAFLLTSHWESGDDSNLVFWWHTPRGPVKQRVSQPAVCFVLQKDVDRLQGHVRSLGWPIQFKEVELTNFHFEPVAACYLPNAFVFRWRSLLEEEGTECWEADIRTTDRYLMERFVYGAGQLQGLFEASVRCEQTDSGTDAVSVNKAAYEVLHGGKVRPSNYRPDLSWVSLDIETNIPRQGEEYRLYSVGLVTAETRAVLINLEYGAQALPQDQLASHQIEMFPNEVALLQALNRRLAMLDKDLILGWNLVQFDIQVLANLYKRHALPMSWGRDGSAVRLRVMQPQQDRLQVHIPGRVALDGIDVLRAAGYDFESFSLQSVATDFLGEGKLLTGSDLGEDIQRLYRENLLQFAAYNLQDCDLVWRIFERADLLAFAIERSAMTGLTMNRMGGSVAAFENLYLPRLHRSGFVAPNRGEGYDEQKSPGGFVMDSRPGLFEHVLVLDFKSLYPSIIRTFKIDPMGLVYGLRMPEGLSKPNDQWVEGFFGGRFDQSKHILPDLIRQLGEWREAAKCSGNQSLSQAIKIIMASCYGVLGSPGCRFHDTRLSASITKRGHEIILRSEDWIRQQGHEVIYGDTDSVFVLVANPVSDVEADALGNNLAKGLNDWWQYSLQREFSIQSWLEIEYETHYRRFFMPSLRGEESGSKKRYAGLIRNVEGEPQMVFKGLESVRSDWTPLARQFQAELYRRVFLNIPYQDWVQQQVEQLLQGGCDDLLVYRKRLRQPLAAYERQIPPHARAAQRLDRWRQQQGLRPRFQHRGGWIDYRISVNGPEPVEQVAELGCHLPLSPPDYGHYLEKQLIPIAEALFQYTGDSVEELLGRQGSLF